MYTQGINKEYSGFVSDYPNIVTILITIIGIFHFITYKETTTILSGGKTKADIIYEHRLSRKICILSVERTQYYYSKFLIGKVNYNLIIKFSDFLENNLIFGFRLFKKFLYFLSSVIVGVLLLITIFLSLTNLNYPNGSQYDYLEVNNVKCLIIGEYRGNFIVANYYRVEDLQKEFVKQYNDYDYIINTFEYRLIKIEGQKLGKVDLSNVYIEKKIKVK